MTTAEKRAVHDMRQSFPSGHTSFTFFAMVYAIVRQPRGLL